MQCLRATSAKESQGSPKVPKSDGALGGLMGEGCMLWRG